MSGIPGLNTAILDFCTRLDDGPRDEAAARREFPKRDPAEYKWLREALASIEQPEQRMKKLLEAADKPEVATSDDDVLMQALEEMQDMVEDLNLATEFELMGGPARVLRLLRKTTDPEVRRVVAMVIAQSAQNHERLQKKYVDEKFADILIPMLAQETSSGARAAIVFAISSICRAYSPASGAFLRAGGLGVLFAVVTARALEDSKSTARCLRLIGYFAEECATAAAPLAQVSCQLATSDLKEADEPSADQQESDSAAAAAAAAPSSTPSAEVATAAAFASGCILSRCVAAASESSAIALGAQCVRWLRPWAASSRASDAAEKSHEHQRLLELFKAAEPLFAAGSGVGTQSDNKTSKPDAASDSGAIQLGAPTELTGVPNATTAAASHLPLGLPAPPAATAVPSAN